MAEDGADSEQPTKQKQRRTMWQQTLKTIQMPLFPTCVSGTNSAMYDCRVWITGKTKKEMYIAIDDLPWLIAYAADEYKCQGVERSIPDEHILPAANCPNVPDFSIVWDFSVSVWCARFVAGPHILKSRKLCPNDVSAALLEEVKLEKGEKRTKKACAKRLLIMWGNAIVQDIEAQFNQTYSF
jgi:hypothetical protein